MGLIETKMKYNITIKEIMQNNFPIVDASENLADCANLTGDNRACLIMDKGRFRGILTPKKVMEGFMNAAQSVEEIAFVKEIGMVDAREDISYLIRLMEKTNARYVLVKEDDNIIGLVSRDDLKKVAKIIVNRFLIINNSLS